MSEPAGSRRYLIGGGAAACAPCCAPPVLALLGIAGSGLVATAATLAFAGVTFAVVVMTITVAGYAARQRRVHHARTRPSSASEVQPMPDLPQRVS